MADEQAMRDEALVEGAVADAVPQGTNIAEVADLQFDGDAHAAALDLSLADGRFAPDVLEVAARRAVAAWAEAVDGDDAGAEGDRARRRRPGTCCIPATRAAHAAGRARPARSSRSGSSRSMPVPTPPTMTIEVDLDRPALHRGP